MRVETRMSATILLVDDADEYRALIKRGLERRGYRVKTACDEQDAIERAQCVRPDMILLEMGRVPPLRTLDMGCRVRSDAKIGDGVNVVVYADRADETVPEGGEVSMGPNEYVILPEDGDQLESFLARILHK
jgi:two-component system OmpR family response regulator